jgi:hypothetical protein
MKKAEMERVLMDCNEAKKFCECAIARNPCGTTGTEKPPTAQLRRIEPLPHQKRPTIEEVKKHFRSHEQPYLLSNIERYIPELDGKSPLESLEFLASRFRKKPSKHDLRLIEDAINRMTIVGELDGEAQKIVREARGLLSAKSHKKQKKESDTGADNIWAQVFQHSDYKGASLFLNEWAGIFYKKVSNLSKISFNDCISSVQTGCSSEETGGTLVLFERYRYSGRYWRIDSDPSSNVDIPYVGNFINDKTSSVLLIRRFGSDLTPTPIGDLVSRDDIKAFVKATPGIELRGEPILTWDMWPEGEDWHPNEPDKAYIYIKIPIVVDVPNWFDYDAEIRYWVYLYVDSAGTLQGYVDYYGAWVEGGIITDSVLNGLMNQIPTTLGGVSTLLGSALALGNAVGPFENVYFLPGHNDQQGNTDDDVTIVLMKLLPVSDEPIA